MEKCFQCHDQPSQHSVKLRGASLRMYLVMLLIILLSTFTPLLFADQSKVIEIIYPSVNNEFSRDFDPYFLKVLRLGMDNSGRKYHIKSVPVSTFFENRSEFILTRNHYNLHWLNTNVQREESLLPIRIPLFKGLIGWRLLFIKDNKKHIFANINTLTELQPYLSGHGYDWPDPEIFKANNLAVVTSPSWSGLFKMLQAERIDYFPRSIIEIWREQQFFPEISMHIEDRLALHYPGSYYFFTNKQNNELAEALTNGLNIAIEDGSFDKLFMEHFGEIIKKAELGKRTIIELKNPHFQAVDNPAYWYNPLSHNQQH